MQSPGRSCLAEGARQMPSLDHWTPPHPPQTCPEWPPKGLSGLLSSLGISAAAAAAAAAKSLQSCPTMCDPRDSSLPGSPVLGILQARILEWVAISFSNA